MLNSPALEEIVSWILLDVCMANNKRATSGFYWAHTDLYMENKTLFVKSFSTQCPGI
jgi:hypothetical protein